MNGAAAGFVPGGGAGATVEDMGGLAGGWMEMGRGMDDGFPVTAMAFDPVEELLWTGSQNGRLSAFSQPDMVKHVSVLGHGAGNPQQPQPSPVRQIRPFLEGILSISSAGVKMHTRQCLHICSAPAAAMLKREGEEKKERRRSSVASSVSSVRSGGAGGASSSSEDEAENNAAARRLAPAKEEFTCGALHVASGGHMMAYQGEHVTVGGSKKTLWQLDLMTGLTVLNTIEVPCGSTCMESNRSIIVGGVDGKLRFLDGMMRSDRVERELEAYTGAVTSMCTWGGDLLVVTGTQGRSLNPYDTSGTAPTRYVSDPMIKVFDLRMLRQTLPLSFAPAMIAPNLLGYIPGKDRLVVGSGASGQFLTCDPYNVSAADTEFFHVMNEAGGHDPLACMAVAGSGEMLAFGTHDGGVITWAQHPDAAVNLPPQPIERVPLAPPPPPASITPADPNPASHYVLRPVIPHGEAAYLLGPLLEPASSFATTPGVMDLALRYPPRRVLNPGLLTKMAIQDFGIGYVSNAHLKLPLNSLLFGQGHKEAYVVVDPRRRAGAEGPEGGPDEWGYYGEGGAGGVDSGAVPSSWEAEVPQRYRRVHIDFSKRGLDGFDFARHNATPLAGLENLLPNSYTNALLQLLFYVPEVRAAVLQLQYVPTCHSDDKSLSCELGFLFHMLHMAHRQAQGKFPSLPPIQIPTPAAHEEADGAQQPQQQQQQDQGAPLSTSAPSANRGAMMMGMMMNSMLAASEQPPPDGAGGAAAAQHQQQLQQPQQPPPKPCQSSNFLRAFRHAPEAVALGLLESKASPVQIRAEGFHRFLLMQVHAEERRAAGKGEEDEEEGSSVVDRLYGYTARTTSTFLTPPGVPPKTTETRSFLLELVYPRSLGGAGGGSGSSPVSSPTLGPQGSAAAAALLPPSLATLVDDAEQEGKEKAGTRVERVKEVLRGLAASGSGNKAPALPAFCQILHQSLQREARSRGWCEQSKGYEPLKQVRQLLSLPTILALHGGVQGNDVAAHIWHQLNPLGGGWLPEHVTVRGRKQEARGVLGGLVVSECWRAGGEEGESLWVASADGKGVGLEEEVLAAAKAQGEGGEEVERAYELMAVVSFIASGGRTAPESQDGHLVLHVKVPAPEAANATTTAAGAEAPWQWFILNDFLVEPTIVEDALGFLPSWKEPCVLLYRARDSAAGTNQQWAQLLAAASSVGDPGAPRSRIPPAVFESPSLSSGAPGPRTFTPLPADKLPGKGDLVGIDAEFVALEMETASVREDGTRVVSKEGRQALARLSIIDCRTGLVLMDDYVLPSEPVMDHLTRFSGITPEDLDPSASRHHLLAQRTVYLKLRHLIDRGVTLVGHGLKKDFRIINVFVPPAQVIDTVELWSLEHQRKISLRFLAAQLLGESIQGETHDSIEDARTALRLYKKYLEHKAAGTFERALNGVYEVGRKTQWKLGALPGQQQAQHHADG